MLYLGFCSSPRSASEMARVKFGRDGEGDMKALEMGNCSINIWGESEIELAWSKKSSSYFENNFPIFLLSDIWTHWFLKCVMFYIE